MADVKWIKIVTDIFDDEKILLIEHMPSADSMIVIWFKLLCFAGKQNNSGVIMLNDRIAYTDEMLATIFRRDVNTVRMALAVFEQFDMIRIVDGVITIPNWGKHQNLDQLEKKKEYMRNYMREYREKQQLLTDGAADKNLENESNSKTNSKANVSRLDKEEDKDIDKEEDKDNKPGKKAVKKPAKHKHGEFQNVLLTDTEFEKLAVDFGSDLRDTAISFFDAYIEEKRKFCAAACAARIASSRVSLSPNMAAPSSCFFKVFASSASSE